MNNEIKRLMDGPSVGENPSGMGLIEYRMQWFMDSVDEHAEQDELNIIFAGLLVMVIGSGGIFVM